MEILLDYYKAMRNKIRIPDQEDNEKLSGIDRNDYQFNYGYLIKHDLVDGKTTGSDDGAESFVPIGGITGLGMDIVESFIDGCVENVEKNTDRIIDKTLSNLNKIIELTTIWTTNFELYQQALDLLAQMIQ